MVLDKRNETHDSCSRLTLFFFFFLFSCCLKVESLSSFYGTCLVTIWQLQAAAIYVLDKTCGVETPLQVVGISTELKNALLNCAAKLQRMFRGKNF